MVAPAETVPDVLAHAYPELSGVAAFVDRARTAQAVTAPFEPVDETVMFKDLLHGDGRFHSFEVNEL
jgi:hypothetical protein